METLYFAASIMKDKSPDGRPSEELTYTGPFQGLKDIARVGAVLGGMILYAGLLGTFLAR